MSAIDAMEPRLLRSFIAVAEELHFGRAAARLHISQPPLSVQIRKLERALGVTLFERDRRHVALTEAGSFLVERARAMLGEAERSWREAGRIARGEAGTLAVGYTSTATYDLLPPLVRAFTTQSPNVRLELVEMRTGLQPEALRTGRIEVGFGCGPVEEDGVAEHVLVRERFVAALPRQHPLTRKSALRMRDLDAQPMVQVRPDVEPTWAQACARSLAHAGVRPALVQETDTKIALLGLVATGIGISIVSGSMMCLARAGVVFREITDLAVRVPLVALLGAQPSPRALACLRLARSSLAR